jgi:cell division transport system permease protein
MGRMGYFLQETVAQLRGNKISAGMTILTIASSMLIFGLFLLLYVNLSAAMSSLRSEIRILLYLHEGLSESAVSKIRETVESEPGIAGVKYVSEKQAMDDFMNSMDGNEGLLKGLGDHPLPASLELSVVESYRSSDSMAQMAERFAKIKGVDEVQYGREWVEQIENWLWVFRAGAMGIGALLAFTVTAIVANTIQLALSSRRNEVEVLRLIGATRGFVCIPFVLEGGLIGFLSSGLALLLLWSVFRLGGNSIPPGSGLLSVPGGISFLPFTWLAGLILMGVGLGCAGSYWPFRKWN